MKAMILAAGLGTRMRPLTLKTPKPLLEVGGKPLIQWHIERLVEAGINELVVNHAWLGEQIESYLGSGDRLGCSIQYTAEGEPMETGGGIFNALHKLIEHEDESFLVVNADVFCDLDFNAFLTPDLAEQDLGRLLMVKNPAWHAKGDFLFDQSSGYLQSNSGESLTFSGISLLRGRLFHHCQPGVFPLAPLLRDAIAKNQLQARKHLGFWSDIGTPERLDDVNQMLMRGAVE